MPKLAILTNDGLVPPFAIEAIGGSAGEERAVLFSCIDARRDSPVPFALRLLNFLLLRHARSKPVRMSRLGAGVEREVRFQAGHGESDCHLPDRVVDDINGSACDFVLQLVPGRLDRRSAMRLKVPILSLEAVADTERRPERAAFWGIVRGRTSFVQAVTVTDPGSGAERVAAHAESKIYPHAYGKTVDEAYRDLSMLLRKLIRTGPGAAPPARQAERMGLEGPTGRHLWTFLLRMSAAFARRVLYGAFFEKQWRVSHAPADLAAVVEGKHFPAPQDWTTLAIPPDYLFYADPFFNRGSRGILVEAMNRKSLSGEILLVEGEERHRLSAGTQHYSYPSTFVWKNETFIIPEVAQWSPLRIYRLDSVGMAEAGRIQVAGDPRILDPTLLEKDGRIYLFGNAVETGVNSLLLWSAPSLWEPFELHPMSPLRISPCGSRMAGGILRVNDRLIRFGQNFLADYGAGILAFEIDCLEPDRYEERPLGTVAFSDRKGPHTVNFDDGQIVFDWYVDRFSLFAGARRLIARFKA